MAAMGALALMTIGQSYAQSEAQRAEGKYQKTMADINARNANIQAQDAILRGEKQAQIQARNVRRAQASQQASFAAAGVSGSGMEEAVLGETASLGEADIMQIKNNAWREAWGFKSQAAEYTRQGQFAESMSKMNARNTLLAGGIQSASYAMAGYGKTKSPSSPKAPGNRVTTTSTGSSMRGYA